MEPVLAEVDKILERHNGRRLADEVDALGSVSVETTVAGIPALAASDYVKGHSRRSAGGSSPRCVTLRAAPKHFFLSPAILADASK